MKLLNAGVLRRATGHARAARLAKATTLIQKTLSQHGLSDTLGVGLALKKPTAPTIATPHTRATGRHTYRCAQGTREYIVQVPVSAQENPAGLLLMLHGCTQTPEDFAIGTGMNALAATHGLIVIYPAQSRGDNAQSCWNWFSPGDQLRDTGEPAILAGLVRQIAAVHGNENMGVFVAGLSAGAAMAVVLGQTYPDLFDGIGAHSGLPYGCARNIPEAFAAMAGGNEPTSAARSTGHPTPTIVFHGSQDQTVAPGNGERVFNDVQSQGSHTQVISEGVVGGRSYRTSSALSPTGNALAEHWIIDGLGHAWSGGQPGGSYTDPVGPDASAEMVRFFLSLRCRADADG